LDFSGQAVFMPKKHGKTIGKLIPMAFSIQSLEQLDDLLAVAEYKKKLK